MRKNIKSYNKRKPFKRKTGGPKFMLSGGTIYPKPTKMPADFLARIMASVFATQKGGAR